MYTQKAVLSKLEWSTVGVQVRAEVTAAVRAAKRLCKCVQRASRDLPVVYSIRRICYDSIEAWALSVFAAADTTEVWCNFSQERVPLSPTGCGVRDTVTQQLSISVIQQQQQQQQQLSYDKFNVTMTFSYVRYFRRPGAAVLASVTIRLHRYRFYAALPCA